MMTDKILATREPRSQTLLVALLALGVLWTAACGSATAGDEVDPVSEASTQVSSEASAQVSSEASTEAPAEASSGDARLFSPEELRADADFLYANLQEAHYDLFVHTSREVYDARFEALRRGLTRPLSLDEATLRFQRFVALGKIGHARLELPLEAYAAFRSAGGRAAPFYFRVVEGRVFITEDYSGAAGLAPGDELLSMEGEPMATWLDRLTSLISAETDAMAYSLLEFRFPQLLWFEIGEVETLELEVRSPGEQETRSIRALTRTVEQVKAAIEDAPPRLSLDWTGRSARLLEGGVAYLRPGPFYEPESAASYDPTAFRSFIDDSFERFLAAGAEDLLVDLRDNPGGDKSFSDLMVAWFADRPFRFCSSFTVKVSPQSIASHERRQAANPNLEDAYSKLYAEHAPGEKVEYPFAEAQPRQGERFEGRVYVLINRHSYSNAVTVAALIQDYDFGVILGEATSDLASSYGAMEHFELPATGLSVGYPKAFLVRPSGDERLAGVTPDLEIETPVIEGLEDPVLERALDLIGKRAAGVSGGA